MPSLHAGNTCLQKASVASSPVAQFSETRSPTPILAPSIAVVLNHWTMAWYRAVDNRHRATSPQSSGKVRVLTCTHAFPLLCASFPCMVQPIAIVLMTETTGGRNGGAHACMCAPENSSPAPLLGRGHRRKTPPGRRGEKVGACCSIGFFSFHFQMYVRAFRFMSWQ